MVMCGSPIGPDGRSDVNMAAPGPVSLGTETAVIGTQSVSGPRGYYTSVKGQHVGLAVRRDVDQGHRTCPLLLEAIRGEDTDVTSDLRPDSP